jgi:hypothetical protein
VAGLHTEIQTVGYGVGAPANVTILTMRAAWYWIQVVLTVLGAIVIFYQLPSAVRGISRALQEWWALRSHRTSTTRLAKLEVALQHIDDLPVMDERQTTFYGVVLLVFTCICVGLASAAYYGYVLLDSLAVVKTLSQPSLLPISVGFFLAGGVISMVTANYLMKFSPLVRTARRVEIEKGIAELKKKLAADAARPANR